MAARTVVLRDASGAEHAVAISPDGVITIGDTTVALREMADGSLQLPGPPQRLAWAVVSDGTGWVYTDGRVFTFEAGSAARRRSAAAHHGPITAPMPATVRKVAVAVGDRVARGDVLIVLEAMKMEMPVRSNTDGTVRAINCREGEMVKPGDDLVDLEP